MARSSKVWSIAVVLVASIVLLDAQDITSSNLPLIAIDTGGAPILNEPKNIARMGIVHHGGTARNHLTDRFDAYDGLIGIELRGNSTQTFEKKPYTFETLTPAGEELKTSLLGLPPESDWVLSASYIDKTFIRDPLAYEIARRMGRWASHTIHCELVLNGEYQGIYILEERIKRDKARVDVAKLDPDDTSDSRISGGYVFELNQGAVGFDSQRRFVHPREEHITARQVDYIRSYYEGFRASVGDASRDGTERAYAAWIDTAAFVDEILVQELAKNPDAYGWSSYFHKDRGNKLAAGPVWDFDQAFSNSVFNDGPNYSQWMIEKSATDDLLKASHPTFWIGLFQDVQFKRELSRRWMALRRDALDTDSLMTFIDDLAGRLDEAQERNFRRWDILGRSVWRSTPGADQRRTYQSEVVYLKDFLRNRLTWMDAELAGVAGDPNQ